MVSGAQFGMLGITRRAGLAGMFATCAAPSVARADQPIPPEGIGNRVKFLSHSDQGGRPDGVQVMVNRGHVYVGHMFSNGITVRSLRSASTRKAVCRVQRLGLSMSKPISSSLESLVMSIGLDCFASLFLMR